MADAPDLIIRTAEELEAEKVRFLLAENPWTEMVFDMSVREEDIGRPIPDGARTWWFRDREALNLFAAVRIMELACEGVASVRDYTSRYEHCYDKRTKSGIEHFARSELEW